MIRVLGWLAAWGVVLSGATRAAEPVPTWEAGAAQVDITPERPVWMAGYASRKEPSRGVAHPLRAKALALRDGSGRTLVFVTADLIGFDRTLTGRITDRLRDKHGLPREAVALFASHTHAGPILKDAEEGFDAYGVSKEDARDNVEYVRGLEETLVALVGDALATLKPATAAYGVGTAGFAMNRRERTTTGYKLGVNPAGPVDRTVPVLRITGPDGALRAVVFGYACHNTTLTGEMQELAGDYAGFAQAELEASHPGAVALFVTGCAGDANPDPRGTLDLARRHGRTLAGAVEEVLSRPLPALSGPLRADFAEPTIRFAGPTDRETYARRAEEPGAGRQKHAKRLLARIDAGQPLRTEYPYPIHAFALGDGPTLVALAGEVVVDYAIRLREELGGEGRPLWVAAYADDVFGYVGSARVIREGGYEGLDSYYYSSFPAPLDEGVEETIVSAVRGLVGRVRNPHE